MEVIDGIMTFDLDFSKRHCWELKDGTYRVEGSFDELCKNFNDHPKKAGKSEFMRFVHNFPVDGIFTGFPDGWLTIGPDTLIDGREVYCENYGGKIKAFLDVNRGIATIEVHDPELDWAIPVALNEVEREYQNL